MAPPSSVPANAAAVAGRGGSECRICPNPRLTPAEMRALAMGPQTRRLATPSYPALVLVL